MAPKLLSFLLLFSFTIFGQNHDWLSYYGPNYGNCVSLEGNLVWTGTKTGLVKYNKLTGSKDFYFKNNSDLPDNFITSIAIDRHGVKWIGTNYGVAKFDGSSWTVFNASNSGLPDNTVTSIAVDTSGNIWIGTNGSGIAKFDGNTWSVFNSQSGVPDKITAIAVDKRNNAVWAGSYASGVSKFDGKAWTWFDPYINYNTYYPDIMALAVDSKGNLWAGTTQKGVEKFDGKTWRFYSQDNFGSPIWVLSIALTETNVLCIGAVNGLFMFTESENRWQKYNSLYDKMPYDRVNGIAIDNDGVLWLASKHYLYEAGGLVTLYESEFQNINISNNGLPDISITAIGQNNRGVTWIGTRDSGVVSYDGNNWKTFNKSNSLIPSNEISSVIVDSENVWVGTTYGLAKYDGKKWSAYKIPSEQYMTNFIRSIAVDNLGRKWFGTLYGLYEQDGNNWTTFTNDSNLPDNDIRAVSVDKYNVLWIGTYGNGIASYDGSKWSIYNSFNSGIPYNDISSIAFDNYNNIWIGTREHGIIKYDGSQWTLFNTNNSGLTDDHITSVTVDRNGNIWVGTLDGGLVKFDNATWKTFTTINSGLTNNCINSIFIDKQNNKWAATEYGISVYREGGVILTNLQEKQSSSLVGRFKLEQNYPNPFNPSTTISYSIPVSGFVKLTIFDILGNQIALLVNEYKSAGSYKASFNGKSLPSGIYLYKLQSGNFSETKKLVLLR